MLLGSGEVSLSAEALSREIGRVRGHRTCDVRTTRRAAMSVTSHASAHAPGRIPRSESALEITLEKNTNINPKLEVSSAVNRCHCSHRYDAACGATTRGERRRPFICSSSGTMATNTVAPDFNAVSNRHCVTTVDAIHIFVFVYRLCTSIGASPVRALLFIAAQGNRTGRHREMGATRERR